jgi:hypothetical protein
MIELKLTSNHFGELIKKGYSLDMIFLMKLIGETDEDYTFSENAKVYNLLPTIKRKGLCTDGYVLTQEGKDLLSFLSSTDDKPKIPRKKKVDVTDDFDKWWKAYPGTDTFTYKGKTFKGTRALRVKKEECKAKIEKVVKSKEYTMDELIEALKLEVSQKQENSFKTGQNKMSYFQNSLTYINQCTYSPYVELVKAGHKAEEPKTTSREVAI